MAVNLTPLHDRVIVKRIEEKEKYALEISLPAVAENHYHPEKHQQRSGCEADQANVEQSCHSGPRADSTPG